ncbi:hypothetical protein SynWH8101_1727 [Synechococcus sp. WH 8101]|uniref:hypothetical protein n=1 Tax=Synechococcus sp. WH 8101 TaxID=59932 RepID=UPI001022EDA2|nr:hypothetical protein [Synechococcus sp. WH 8101]QBE69309.1 hypothetical protein SynWH8101_1727 [Synechococcus sp. WH 8101]QNI45548.1 hypothetical protein SynRCC2555_01768 [Synechococcus sp. WH 8101]
MPAFELISDLHAETLQGGYSRRGRWSRPSYSSKSYARQSVRTNTVQDNGMYTAGALGLGAVSVRDQFNAAEISIAQRA